MLWYIINPLCATGRKRGGVGEEWEGEKGGRRRGGRRGTLGDIARYVAEFRVNGVAIEMDRACI